MPKPEEPGSNYLEEANLEGHSDLLTKAILGDDLYKAVAKIDSYVGENEYEELVDTYDDPVKKLMEDAWLSSGEDAEKYTEILENALLAVNFRLRLYQKFMKAAE